MSTDATAPAPTISIFAPDGSIIGDRLSEKPFLEECREWCENVFRTTRYSRKDRLWVEGQMKLSMYYGDQSVLVYDSGDDWIVIAHSDGSDDIVYRTLRAMSPEVRAKVTYCTPIPWGE